MWKRRFERLNLPMVASYDTWSGKQGELTAKYSKLISKKCKIYRLRQFDRCHGVQTNFQIYSYIQIIDIDVKYILLFIVCKLFYAVDICYCCSSVIYI